MRSDSDIKRPPGVGSDGKSMGDFVRVTSYHSKHALRVLNRSSTPPEPRGPERLYNEAVHQALTVLWEAADRICGKRLRVLRLS